MNRRMCRILYGLESILEGLFGDHIVFGPVSKLNKGWHFNVHVRKWHPAHWVGYIRCVWLGDKCGSAYYTPASSSVSEASEGRASEEMDA